MKHVDRAAKGSNPGEERALARARRSYAEHLWSDAYAAYVASERDSPLALDDLAHFATAARLINREDESAELWIRVHHAAIDAGEPRKAIRAASWLALSLLARGEQASAAGWLARSRRLLAQEQEESVERGYHLMAVAMQCVRARDIPGGSDSFEHAARIAERFGDRDLLTRANQGRARTMIVLGNVAAGGELLDEVLVAVTASEVSSLAVGDIYCSAIEACYEMFDMRRAREWTAALTRWCDGEPSLVLYRGTCQVRRAEVLQFNGAWPQALDQAGLARDSMAAPPPDRSIGGAYYRVAELRRLRGDFKGAAQAYREASDAGHSALPGLALLRLSEGAGSTARATLERALDETKDKRIRARLLAAFAEVLLRAVDVESADEAARELQILAADFESIFLRATSSFATASVMLARGLERQALPLLRQSFDDWRELEAPYEVGRTRMLIAHACIALGDAESAQLELNAAWRIFHQLGAAPDLANAERLGAKGRREVVEERDDRLTPREQEVLTLLATGMTNRALAAELGIAEKTVARHVSNIFTKLGVTTRAAATAYALRRPH